MVGLPRSIIKKYGVTKKAWAVFRGSRSSGSKSRGGKMARRTRRGYAKARRGRSRGGMGGILKHGFLPLGGGIMGLALSAVAGYAAATYINPKLPQVIPMQDKAVALAAGGLPGVIGSMFVGSLIGGSSTGGSGSIPTAGV